MEVKNLNLIGDEPFRVYMYIYNQKIIFLKKIKLELWIK